MHELTAKALPKAGKCKFEWSTEANESFVFLKNALCEAPVLAFPRFDRDFTLEVDASLRGLGACLSQFSDDGDLHPVAYASRGLRGAERNYADLSSFKLELLAMKWAVSEKFREYLLGRHTVVWTDNNPLAHLQTAKLGATEQRWVAQLASFDLEIKYRSGRSNKCADALSRLPSPEGEVNINLVEAISQCTNLPVELQTAHSKHSVANNGQDVWIDTNFQCATPSLLPSYSHTELSSMQKEDDALKEIWYRWQSRWEPGQAEPENHQVGRRSEVKGWLKEWPRIVEKNGILYRSVEEPGLGQVYQLLVPKCLRLVVVEASHDQWGHQGIGRTLSFVKRRCFWPGITGFVREHVQNCFHCIASKAPTPTVRPPMRHLLAFKPLERVAIDFLKLDRGRGNFEDVLVMTDSFTKFAAAVPCKDQTAETVARVLRDKWFACYGVPMQIHSDRGRNFESRLISELCCLYGIRKTRTTPYHAQGNGQTERFNKTLCGLIKSLDNKSRSQWPQLLPHLLFIYNATPHSVTGYAPYTLMFGREPSVPLDNLLNSARKDWKECAISQQAELISKTYKVAKDRMMKAADANKKLYDKKVSSAPLPVDSLVLLKHCAFTERHKLKDNFNSEQYIVVKANAENDIYAIRPSAGGKEKWVNRKLLVLDPRGLDVKFGEPLRNLPSVDGTASRGDSCDSETESDDDLVMSGPPVKSANQTAPSPVKSGVTKESGGLSDIVGVVPKVVKGKGPRRSERLRRKCSGSWPNDIT